MDEKTYKRVQHLIRTAIVPFHGTAYVYEHLIAPKKWLGFLTPIKDIWAQNMTRLLSQTDLGLWEGATEPPAPPFPPTWMGSLVMKDHLDLATRDFLTIYFDEGYLPFASKRYETNKNVYDLFLDYGYKEDRQADFHRKLENFGVEKKRKRTFLIKGLGNYSESILRYAKSVNPKIGSHAVATHLAMVFNAITTSCRRRDFHGPPTPCPFCGIGKDHIYHYWALCPVIRDARNIFSKSLRLGLEKVRAVTGFHLAILATDSPLSPNQVNAILIFNSVTWLTCTRDMVETLKMKKPVLSRTMAARAVGRWNAFNSSEDVGRFLNFGNAKSRSKEQMRAASDHVNEIITRLPLEVMIFFTDGSASPNPGPAGGAVAKALSPRRA
jgi:hypothetical protein